MLTVWRRLHIEIDSMGIVENNAGAGRVIQTTAVATNPIAIPVRGYFDLGRFENGRMSVGGNILYVDTNTENAITVHSFSGTVIIPNNSQFVLYDDDDFNNDNILNGFDADNGENVTALSDSFNLLQDDDDKDCSDLRCNVLAEAYIRPAYGWASQYASDTPFVLNVDDSDADIVEDQIETGISTNTVERNDFWVAYVQIAYQPLSSVDCDPNQEGEQISGCSGGVTPAEGNVDSVTSSSTVPVGGEGSLVFIETVRDFHLGRNRVRARTVPHEIGHQF